MKKTIILSLVMYIAMFWTGCVKSTLYLDGMWKYSDSRIRLYATFPESFELFGDGRGIWNTDAVHWAIDDGRFIIKTSTDLDYTYTIKRLSGTKIELTDEKYGYPRIYEKN